MAPVADAVAAADRIWIMGSPGAGKSILARNIAALTGHPVVHLDRVFWDSHWCRLSLAARQEIVHKIVGQPRWIVDGTYLSVAPKLMPAVQLVLVLSESPVVCTWRLLTRPVRNGFDRPADSRDRLRGRIKVVPSVWRFRRMKVARIQAAVAETGCLGYFLDRRGVRLLVTELQRRYASPVMG